MLGICCFEVEGFIILVFNLGFLGGCLEKGVGVFWKFFVLVKGLGVVFVKGVYLVFCEVWGGFWFNL